MAIEILKSDVIDQIAAGEVLERPANLVKELVENSLDAGASEVRVDYSGGGRSVTVSDNGSGMSAQDLKICLQRHATSKIRKSDDLYSLSSFGFRGEALASVAGVSEMAIVSRSADQTVGHRLVAKFGQCEDLAEVAASPGTEVFVRELFANVPARLEFLKSDGAEHGQIKNIMKAFALAREDVSFFVTNAGEVVYHWPNSESFIERAKTVLDHSELYSAVSERDGIRVEVAVSSPLKTQAVNRNLWFFVQGRYIQDRTLTAAVMEAYRNLLMHGEYPTAVVRISLPPDSVDVNVHPTKSAVKFKDSQALFRAVTHTIRAILEKAPWLEATPKNSPPTFRATTEQTSSYAFHSPEFSRVQYSTKAFPLQEVRETVQNVEPRRGNPQSSFTWSSLQVIGQAHLTYIVAQTSDSFYLVDQHAAHERVVFERLMKSYQSGQIEIQNLLLPLVIDLPEGDLDAILSEKATLEKWGVNLERRGPESLIATTLPALISETSLSEALKMAAHTLGRSGGGGALADKMGDIFATMACHSVVRAGQSLSREQMEDLLRQMDEFPLSSFCPHGRPVYVRRPFTEIEREFGRIV